MDFRQLFKSGESAEPPRPVRLPETDATPAPEGRPSPVEGQRFMIEYEDGNGELSVRRIVARHVSRARGGYYLLNAFCLERRATRCFRADRIICCIDADGEIFEAQPFLLENLGVDIDSEAFDGVDNVRMRQLRDYARPHAQLLAALSRSDGRMHPAEVSVAREHCERICDFLEPNLAECELLYRRFHRIKPDADQIDEALRDIRERPADELTAFLTAAHRLIAADNRLHPEEIAMLNAFSEDLTGVRIA